MNNLVNTIITKIADFAQSSEIKVANHLLNRLIPQKDASATFCIRLWCNPCRHGKKTCMYNCFLPFRPSILKPPRIVSC